MDEARRFLRYISPGLLCSTEVLVLLLLLNPSWTLAQVRSAKEAEGVALVAAALLASGGLGFFLSTIHHTVHWRCGWPRPPAMDHTIVLQRLVDEGMLELRELTPKPVVGNRPLNRREA